jgi:endonuclease YncB( thermonuclease family)
MTVGRVRVAALAMVVGLSAWSCGWFTIKEPYERWTATISYLADGDTIVAEPTRIEVHGPRGELRINNSTRQERGFKIADLGIAERIDHNRSRRLTIAGVQDGETYRFTDDLNPRGPAGVIVVDYVRQD